MKPFFLIIIFLNYCHGSLAPKKDSLRVQEPLKATASININNNGISLFPNLSLGKPATIINLSVGKKNIFFEPELRWGLNGKPWSYIYWLRYKYKKSEHFGFNTGIHPSYVFRETLLNINGNQENRFVSQRYLTAEIVPTYYFSKKIALGLHFLKSKALGSFGIQRSTFVSIQPKLPYLDLNKNYYFSFYPQVFHLVLDDKKGTYFSELLTFSKKDCPISISSVFTYKIKSTIAGNNIVWNIGLNYKF